MDIKVLLHEIYFHKYEYNFMFHKTEEQLWFLGGKLSADIN